MSSSVVNGRKREREREKMKSKWQKENGERFLQLGFIFENLFVQKQVERGSFPNCNFCKGIAPKCFTT